MRSVEDLTNYEFILIIAKGWKNYLLQRARCFGSGQAGRITGIFRRPCKIHSALNCFSHSSDNILHPRSC